MFIMTAKDRALGSERKQKLNCNALNRSWVSLQDSHTVYIYIMYNWNIFKLHLFRYRRQPERGQSKYISWAELPLVISACYNGECVWNGRDNFENTPRNTRTCLDVLVLLGADPTVFSFPCLNSPGVAASQQLPLAASSAGAVGAQFLRTQFLDGTVDRRKMINARKWRLA